MRASRNEETIKTGKVPESIQKRMSAIKKSQIQAERLVIERNPRTKTTNSFWQPVPHSDWDSNCSEEFSLFKDTYPMSIMATQPFYTDRIRADPPSIQKESDKRVPLNSGQELTKETPFGLEKEQRTTFQLRTEKMEIIKRGELNRIFRNLMLKPFDESALVGLLSYLTYLFDKEVAHLEAEKFIREKRLYSFLPDKIKQGKGESDFKVPKAETIKFAQ